MANEQDDTVECPLCDGDGCNTCGEGRLDRVLVEEFVNGRDRVQDDERRAGA